MKPDRNPDGFDHHRRRFVGETLAQAADRVMPRSQARMFKRFLAALERGERPTDPPEPPSPPKRRKRAPERQPRLL